VFIRRAPKWAWVGICIVLATTVMARPTLAHRVNVFAWVEGDTVVAEAKVAGSGRTKNCPITVFDGQGRLLVEGKTGEDGRFAFAKPKGVEALTVVLDAGMGHRAQWPLTAEELGTAAPIAQAPVQETPANTDEGQAQVLSGSDGPVAAAGLGPEQIEAAVAKAVDGPLRAVAGRLDLIAARQEKLDVQNLLGAIGYILGLVGLATWWKYRSKGNTP